MQPRLHRARRLADRRGDLALRQLEEVAQVQHDAVVVRQFVDRAQQRRRSTRRCRDLRVRRALRRAGEKTPTRSIRPPRRCARPHVVEREVRDDAQQPRPERLARRNVRSCRYARTNASWVTSSAAGASRTMRYAARKATSWYRSTSVPNASASPPSGRRPALAVPPSAPLHVSVRTPARRWPGSPGRQMDRYRRTRAVR